MARREVAASKIQQVESPVLADAGIELPAVDAGDFTVLPGDAVYQKPEDSRQDVQDEHDAPVQDPVDPVNPVLAAEPRVIALTVRLPLVVGDLPKNVGHLGRHVSTHLTGTEGEAWQRLLASARTVHLGMNSPRGPVHVDSANDLLRYIVQQLMVQIVNIDIGYIEPGQNPDNPMNPENPISKES